jgi:hypothetical protein
VIQLKKAIKAFLGALAITAVSCLLLILTKGLPTTEQLLWNGGQMFAAAFVVLLFYDWFTQKQS